MTVVDLVLKKVEAMALEEGERLPSERALAETCGISRTSIRNALKEIQSRRILAVKQGSGYFLASQFALEQAVAGQDTGWSIRRICDVMEVRRHVEPHVVALCAENMALEGINQLESCLVALGGAMVGHDVKKAVRLHREFFKILHGHCPNREFIRILNELRIPLSYTNTVFQRATKQERNGLFSEHASLFQLLKKVDSSGAKETCERINRIATELFLKYQQSIIF
ncbi:MAG: FCD domain-containing protein [Desulfuromonadales bacterium]|nr:FCD domain-containing protein [Desulfuromonadales bacterium]MDW7757624.1 FCD domain-containing protein [Desulfuromonadales bacterium]